MTGVGEAAFVATALLLSAGMGAVRKLRRPSTAHGSAGWEKPGKDLFVPKGKALAAGRFIIGHLKGSYLALSAEQTQKHGIIIGGSGTGKSRGFFLPNAAWARNTSLVCTDPKGELWRYTSGYHKRATRFAPTEPEKSACFNWIPLCKSARIAELCARAIVESGNTGNTEQAWLDLETSFLAGLFSHAATLPEPTPITAYRLFTRQPQELLLEQLLSSSSVVAVEQAIIFQQTQERMRGSIVPVVAARLQFLRDPSIARFTSANFFAPDFGRLRREPHALYWCLREQDIARLRPLTSIFFSLLFEQIADEEIEEGEPYTPVVCLLDEFGNIGVIPTFDTTLSLARGRGLSLWLGIQSVSQLESRYGKACADTILTNCSCKIALSGLDVKSATYISQALGETTIVTEKKSRHRRWFLWQPTSATLSTAEHKRFLFTSDEVRRIREDQAIAIVGNRKPLLVSKVFYDQPENEAECSGLYEMRGINLPLLPDRPRRMELPELPADLSQDMQIVVK